MDKTKLPEMIHNFLGLNRSDSCPDTSKVYILPIPFDGTMSYRSGARDGPGAIINASKQVELYDYELKRDISKVGIHTLGELEPAIGSVSAMTDLIFDTAKTILQRDKFLVGIGGEHSVSFGIIKAHAEKYENLSVLQLDAHADLRDSYWDTPYSHASVMRRVREVSHCVQVGMRSFSEEEAEFIKEDGIRLFTAEDILFNARVEDEITEELNENVYITLDLDVFDSSVMPATGTPEPGGLDWYRVLGLLRKVSEKRNIVGFDVVELAPIQGMVAPDFLAAKLLYKMIGYSICL